MQSVTLAWPHRDAHPNSRGQWSKRAKANKMMRRSAYYLAKGACLSAPADGGSSVRLTFFPPDKRRRDLDGCLSASKAYLDGIADALGADDSRFALSLHMAEQTGGLVVVDILT